MTTQEVKTEVLYIPWRLSVVLMCIPGGSILQCRMILMPLKQQLKMIY